MVIFNSIINLLSTLVGLNISINERFENIISKGVTEAVTVSSLSGGILLQYFLSSAIIALIAWCCSSMHETRPQHVGTSSLSLIVLLKSQWLLLLSQAFLQLQ